MFKKANYLILFSFVAISHVAFAQPNCPTLISPADGAMDQDLTVTLTWEAPSTGETPTSYDVYWGQNPAALNHLGNTTGFSQNISTPELGTLFYWRVDAIGQGGTSIGCVEFTYTTLDIPVAPNIDCGSETPVDVVFDLEDQTGWTGDIGTSTQLWKFNTGGTSSSNTGPLQGQAGITSQYLYYEASGSNPVDVSAISPAVDLSTALGDIALTFYMHAYGGGIHQLDVSVGTSATGPFTNIWSWNGQYQSMQEEDWVLVGLNLSDYAGEIVFLNFTNTITVGGGSLGDLAIDEIEVHGCEISSSSNNTCSTASPLATGGESGSLANQYIIGASDSGIGNTGCSGVQPTADVFYTIETDLDGGGIIIDLTSPAGANMHMALYQGTCGSLTEVACESASTDGEDITLNYFDNEAQDNEGIVNRSAAETYILRVYDLNETGQAFDLNATGSGLANLPVKLVSWRAELEKNSVKLKWETAQEVNTEKFLVQKSYDGIRWNNIASVDANGFTNSKSQYSYNDTELLPLQYYRLHIVDYDGYSEHSGIISISRDDIQVEIYPNPVINTLFIDNKDFINETQSYEIFDFTGKKVLSSSLIINNIDVKSLYPGIYNLVLRDGNQVYTSTFNKN